MKFSKYLDSVKLFHIYTKNLFTLFYSKEALTQELITIIYDTNI